MNRREFAKFLAAICAPVSVATAVPTDPREGYSFDRSISSVHGWDMIGMKRLTIGVRGERRWNSFLVTDQKWTELTLPQREEFWQFLERLTVKPA